MANKKRVIIIAGPTAVGKTSVAIDVARRLDTDIISADSRQCFTELNIGVARPSKQQLATVKHSFIATNSINDKVTAATFEDCSLQIAGNVFKTKDVLVMTGGTGLYIKAFCEGMDEIPEVPDVVRRKVQSQYEEKGLPWLQEEVARLDPDFIQVGEMKNPRRLMRALEVINSTGKSILDFRRGLKVKRDFEIIKVALDLPKQELHRNIENRVDEMMQSGLVEEARSLIPYQHLNALQTVGYKELFEYFHREIDLEQAVNLIKRNTRQYAKRQLTWFKKDKDYHWIKPVSAEVIRFLETIL